MRNALKLLMIFTFMSLTAFSQVGTDSVVVLPKATAIKVLQDLERKDQLEQEVDDLNDLLAVEAQKISIKDGIIDNYRQIEANMAEQISRLNEITINKDSQIEHWRKQYKKQKRQKFIIGGVGLILVALFAVG
jgi:phage terminase small subunit